MALTGNGVPHEISGWRRALSGETLYIESDERRSCTFQRKTGFKLFIVSASPLWFWLGFFPYWQKGQKVRGNEHAVQGGKLGLECGRQEPLRKGLQS